jgi:outer membrane lipoprotein SlyB
VASAHKTRYRHRHRTFWQKHRDKLTVAGTTLGGAGIGGLAGGKKGAAIGAIAGGGSGALYTYKLRKRTRHRRY